MDASVSTSTSKAVLITGCSTGIGRATAEHLARRGWTVYATARRPERIQDLAGAGCRILALDVCDEASIRAAVGTVEQAEGAIGVLVNNAGYGQEGAFEATPMAEIRRQFETNVFGLVRLTQLALPGHASPAMGQDRQPELHGRQADAPGRRLLSRHEARRGSAERCAALRGAWIRRRRHRHRARAHQDAASATRRSSSIDSPAAGDPAYAAFNAQLATKIKEAYEGPMGRFAAGPEAVALVIEKAITAPRPAARYTVTAAARILMGLRRVLPDRAFDAFLRTQFAPPGTLGIATGAGGLPRGFGWARAQRARREAPPQGPEPARKGPRPRTDVEFTAARAM